MTNKRHLKTFTWAATVLLAGFILLAGCGNDKPTPTPEDPGDEKKDEEPTGEYKEEYAFNLVSYNIWVNTSGTEAWLNRKAHVAKRMIDHDADIVGMQEVRRTFIDDLKALMPDFSFYGIGRDSGGEGCDIMWRTDRFSRLDSGQFWYSDTPGYSSNGWDGNYFRMCTWVKFKDKKSEKEFYVFNSHMALAADGRKKSSTLLISKVREIAGDTPYYCTGDFNSEPLEEPMVELRTEMDDAFFTLSTSQREGPTVAGFTFPSQADFTNPTKRIDFCMMSKGAKAFSYKVIGDDITEKVRASDHLPVLIRTVPSAD